MSSLCVFFFFFFGFIHCIFKKTVRSGSDQPRRVLAQSRTLELIIIKSNVSNYLHVRAYYAYKGIITNYHFPSENQIIHSTYVWVRTTDPLGYESTAFYLIEVGIISNIMKIPTTFTRYFFKYC